MRLPRRKCFNKMPVKERTACMKISEPGPRNRKDTLCGPEQSCMAGDAAHGGGIFVVHLPSQKALPPVIPFRRSNGGTIAGWRGRGSTEKQRFGAERLGHRLVEILVEQHPARSLDDDPEHDESQIAVKRLLPCLA